ncbi:MAG TPA: alpha/beta hydrolase [Propionibacteriaceae bacterium]|jgi:pimeloyl-ACP methyl ester carboxylesterase
MKPRVVLVHGAFAESASWNSVIDTLLARGYDAVAAANPLRGIAVDAAAVSDLVRSIDGPVLLVGHSYGGAVITNVDRKAGDIRGLVYVCGFAPDAGESAADLSSKAPGGTLGETLTTVELADGGRDLYISQHRFHQQFTADSPADVAAQMAVTQRPVTEIGLFGPSGSDPLWKDIPSWFVYGELDHNIPAGAHLFMAERAHGREILEVAGAAHALPVSRPDEVAQMILEAAKASELVDA